MWVVFIVLIAFVVVGCVCGVLLDRKGRREYRQGDGEIVTVEIPQATGETPFYGGGG